MERRRQCRECGGSGIIEWGMFCRPCHGQGWLVVEEAASQPPAPATPEEELSAQELINLANWSANHKLDRLAEAGLDTRRAEFARYLVRQGIVGED